MILKDIMNVEVAMVPPSLSIQEAAEKMRALKVGSLLVFDGRRLNGMITDRDIAIRGTAAGRDPKTTLVNDCLSSELIYGFEDQDLQEAQTLMEKKEISRLPVLNHDKKIVGIVTLADLRKAAKGPAAHFPQTISSWGWGSY
jgi:CBS domain-containing protein